MSVIASTAAWLLPKARGLVAGIPPQSRRSAGAVPTTRQSTSLPPSPSGRSNKTCSLGGVAGLAGNRVVATGWPLAPGLASTTSRNPTPLGNWKMRRPWAS